MIPKIEYRDFEVICRLCMAERVLTNILDKPELIKVYSLITNLRVKKTDSFPKNICNECEKKLELVQNFIRTCRDTHDILTAAILHQNDKNILNENIKNENIFDINDDRNHTENEDDCNSFDQGNDISAIYTNEIKIEMESVVSHSNVSKRNKIKLRRNNLFRIHSKKTKKSKSMSVAEPASNGTETLAVSKNHSRNKKGNKIWRCFECSKEFAKKNDLQRHLRIHTGARPFVCTECNFKFTQKSTLKRHISAIHILDQIHKFTYECFICERKFNRKDHLESHVVTCHIKKVNEQSIENPPLKTCTECGKSFSLYSYIKQHMAIHVDKKPKSVKPRREFLSSASNLCSFCGKSFEKRATYLQHMRRTHGPPLPKKPKEQQKAKLNESPHQSYQCWHCGKIKSTLCNLKVHMRTHTGEKPYECKFCFKRFSAWNSWHDHENIHLGLKPYQCEHCKKVFRQRSSLRKHLRSSIHINLNCVEEKKSSIELL